MNHDLESTTPARPDARRTPLRRRVAGLVGIGVLGVAGGALMGSPSVGAAGPAAPPNTPMAINGVMPVVDSTGTLRRDPAGNLVGIPMTAFRPGGAGERAQRSAAPAGSRTMTTEQRKRVDGSVETVKVETVSVTIVLPDASLAELPFEAIPGTRDVAR